MKNTYFFLLFCFSFILLTTQSVAQENEDADSVNYDYYYQEEEEEGSTVLEPEQTEQAKSYKTEKIEVKKFDENEWKEIVGEETFVEKSREKKERKNQNSRAPVAPWLGLILKVLAYVFIIAIVIALIYLVVKNTDAISGSLQKKSNLFANIQQKIEDINEVDLDAWLAQAIAEKNFKAIIRIQYLITLKNLQKNGLIKYQKDKTNRDYIFEMINKPHADKFTTLTRAYEWIWYGELQFSMEQFNAVENEFVLINQLLNQSKNEA